jgi:predicted extracellular nuclease
VELDPPEDEAESLLYYEALEGMLVQVSAPATAVAPTSKYGEYVLVREEREIERVLRGDPTGMLIFVDDGSETSHADQSTLPYVVQTGDTVFSVTGPLAFTYEKYKVEPLLRPTIITHTAALPRLPEVGADSFAVATFNVENLFDTRLPHPSDPPRPTRDAYELDLAKTANAIVSMGLPTIVGLQEVENVEILEDLVEQEALVEAGYVPVLIEGTDSRGIDVGYLVRGDRATVEGTEARPAPQGLTSRPPLLITVTVELASGPQRVYLLNNHFTSMAAGEEATEPRRTAQAAWNVLLVEEILQREPDAAVVVLGDLNSFYASEPLDTLREGGLRHVYENGEIVPELPYTYIFQGVSETLDHVLVTPALYEHLTGVTALHINADFPPPLPGDPSARRVSDHDPLIAVFTFD